MNAPARREAIAVGLLAGAIVAAVVAVVVARSGFDAVLGSDAQHFHRVALDPFGDGRELAQPGGSVAYRYGRPLYPIVAWLLALGQPDAIGWTLALTYVGSVALLFGLAARAIEAAPVRAFLLALLPGLWFTVPRLVSEPLVVALILAVFLLDDRGRRNAAIAAAAALLLAREVAVLALVPLAVRDLRKRGRRAGAAWFLALVPLAGWWTWVRLRVGEWPFLDPAVSRREALALPLQGPIHVVRADEAQGSWFLFAIVLVLATLVAAWLAVRRAGATPMTQAGVLFAVLLLFLGTGAWRLPGEAVRLTFPAQSLLLVAWLQRSR